jgi:hypothetical protein
MGDKSECFGSKVFLRKLMLVLEALKSYLTLDASSVIHVIYTDHVFITWKCDFLYYSEQASSGSFETFVFQMTPGRGLCSDTTREMKKPNTKLLCQWTKTMAPDLTRSKSQRI